MRRRHFLKLTGTFAASAALPGTLTGCFHGDGSASVRYSFPHGLASGDPRPSSVILWTRLASDRRLPQSEPVTAEVALDEMFAQPVLRATLRTDRFSDYTVRLRVENLQPDTIYFYRFIAPDAMASVTGRTRTAPSPDSTTPVRFACANCQERRHGFYGAYRRMINDDLARPAEEQIQFIVHLGDFIYETRNDPLQAPLDAARNPLEHLQDRNGTARGIAPFPEGTIAATGIEHAQTLADYRHLYQQYLGDPDLQAARARWPFVHIWDDHEFSDDCWQTEANYNSAGTDSGIDEPSQARKVAANQAWFEYIPVDLSPPDHLPAELHHAYDFVYARVDESPNNSVDSSNFANNANNIAAIATLTTYRSLRFGRLLELILTDNRSYRSDHAIPESISGNVPAFLHPRMALPKDLLHQLDAGYTANNGDPDTFIYTPQLTLNPRRNSPPGTILGRRQKQWWKDVMLQSEATWKLWCNSVPLMRFLINLTALGGALPDIVVSGDSWDGYNTERKELLAYLQAQGMTNVVSLAGDYHAHLAGLVLDDYDASTRATVMTEFVCGAVSSISQFSGVEQLSRSATDDATARAVRSLITYDARATANPGADPFVNNMNNTLLHGVAAGLAAAATNSVADALAVKHARVNNHLKYADTDGHGYGLVTVTAERLMVTLVTVDGIALDTGADGPGILRTAMFEVPYQAPGTEPTLNSPLLSGTPPLPLSG